MKKSRFTEQQITNALRRTDSGEAVTEICRQLGVSRQAFYQWRSKHQGKEMMQRRLRQIEEENQKLKRLVADLSLDNHALKEGFSKAVMPTNGNAVIHILENLPMNRRETNQESALR